MSISSHHRTASGRPLRVSPAWVGGARPADGADDQDHLLPVREAVWIWSVRRYARLALWALPAAALLDGWLTLGIGTPPGPLSVALAADWLTTIAMIALAGLLAGTRTRRSALAGLLIGLAGAMLTLPLAALPEGAAAAGSPLTADQMPLAATVATATSGAGWLLLGWAVFRSRLVNPADGVLLMLAAAALGAGTYARQPLPTVGALLLLAAGTGLAWTGGRLIPRA
jgi:Amt family ammonium transporter